MEAEDVMIYLSARSSAFVVKQSTLLVKHVLAAVFEAKEKIGVQKTKDLLKKDLERSSIALDPKLFKSVRNRHFLKRTMKEYGVNCAINKGVDKSGQEVFNLSYYSKDSQALEDALTKVKSFVLNTEEQIQENKKSREFTPISNATLEKIKQLNLSPEILNTSVDKINLQEVLQKQGITCLFNQENGQWEISAENPEAFKQGLGKLAVQIEGNPQEFAAAINVAKEQVQEQSKKEVTPKESTKEPTQKVDKEQGEAKQAPENDQETISEESEEQTSKQVLEESEKKVTAEERQPQEARKGQNGKELTPEPAAKEHSQDVSKAQSEPKQAKAKKQRTHQIDRRPLKERVSDAAKEAKRRNYKILAKRKKALTMGIPHAKAKGLER